MRVRKGDTVEVLSGKNRGKRGQVMRAIPSEGQGRRGRGEHVQAPHQATRADHAGRHHRQGHAASCIDGRIVCSACGRPSRIGMRVDDAGRKLRFCKRCDSEL